MNSTAQEINFTVTPHVQQALVLTAIQELKVARCKAEINLVAYRGTPMADQFRQEMKDIENAIRNLMDAYSTIIPQSEESGLDQILIH